MNTTNREWGFRSVSYWMTLLIAIAVIFAGAGFMLDPVSGAKAYGVSFGSASDLVFGRIAGIRDIFSGLVLLPLLIKRWRKATAWVFTCAIIIPVADCFIIFAVNGSADIAHLLVHGLTAVFMGVASYLLFKD